MWLIVWQVFGDPFNLPTRFPPVDVVGIGHAGRRRCRGVGLFALDGGGLLLDGRSRPRSVAFVDVVDTKRDLIDLNYTLSRVLTFQIDIIMHHNSSLASV